ILPACVSSSRPLSRSKSLAPSCCSRLRMWWLTALCVRCNSWAARVKLLERALASRHRRAVSEGKYGMHELYAWRYRKMSLERGRNGLLACNPFGVLRRRRPPHHQVTSTRYTRGTWPRERVAVEEDGSA